MGKNYDSNKKRDLHDATCGECGKKCQVPFKPTGNKPVLCSDCFEKSGGGKKRGGDRRDYRKNRSHDRRPEKGLTEEQFNELNKKLDDILDALSNVIPRKVDKDDKDSSYEMSEKKSVRAKGEKVSLK